MKKKALAVMLSMAVVLTGLTGCQGNSAAQGSSSAQGNAEPAGDAAAAGTEQAGGESSEAVKEAYDGELMEIIWQWPSMGSTNSGFQAVEDALNAMMEPDIGVHVTLEPVSFSNMANAVSYTHLDVYKRQCLSRGLLPSGKNISRDSRRRSSMACTETSMARASVMHGARARYI